MTRILVTDGNQRSALAVVRSLGKAGFEVYCADSISPTLASQSRYCRDAFVYPSPFEEEYEFVESVAREADRLRIDLIVPMTDITCAVVSEHRAALGAGRTAVQEAGAYWRASDKNLLLALAESIGVPTPVMHSVNCPAEVDSGAIDFPCIVKPARSVLRTDSRSFSTAVRRAHSRTELEDLFRRLPELQHPCTIQRVIEGEGLGVFALCERGVVRILFAHRRLREKPPWGGVSVLREAIPLDPVAVDLASRLLEALRWHGVAMVEFKRDRHTGTLQLMEINARFWGSLQLAVDAGVNFPVEAVNLWLGRTVSRQPDYLSGVRSRWLLGDLDHLLLRLKTSRLKLPADSPPLPALLWDFCQFFRRDTHYEIESWRDPGPSLEEGRSYLRHIFRSQTKQH